MPITSSTLKGHRSSVNCLECLSCNFSSSASQADSQQQQFLVSGSDDETARVWDLRTFKTALCIRTPGAVTSVASTLHHQDDSVVESPFAKPMSIYLSVDNVVLEYDLRQATTPIIQRPTNDLTEVLGTTEEVNQLVVVSSKRGGGSTSGGQHASFSQDVLVAAAEDSGSVRIWDHSRLRVLRPDATASSSKSSSPPFLMTCCAFRSGDQLASGGTNCTVYLWDMGRPRKPLCEFIVPRDDDANGVQQVCNPPMVHSMVWSPSGRLLAAGLGDGSIEIVTVQKKKKLVQLTRLRNGHVDSVASLCFLEFHGSKDRLLGSAGTDGAVLIWDLQRSIGGNVDPRTILSDEMLQEDLQQQQQQDDPGVLFGIPHQYKVNWMVSSQTNTLFIADTTNDITCYTIPLKTSA